MRRRSFLCVPPVLAVASVEGCEMQQGSGLGEPPPWLLWGTSENLEFSSNGFTTGTAAGQLTKINYHRPETWTFLLGGRLLGGPLSGVPATFVEVDFVIMSGLGRSRMVAENFLRLRWDVPLGTRPGNQPENLKYATRVSSPILDDAVGATSRQVIDRIPASDINVTVNVRGLSQAGQPVRLEVFSFWSPRTHIRPDWFGDDDDSAFAGGQLKGT